MSNYRYIFICLLFYLTSIKDYRHQIHSVHFVYFFTWHLYFLQLYILVSLNFFQIDWYNPENIRWNTSILITNAQHVKCILYILFTYCGWPQYVISLKQKPKTQSTVSSWTFTFGVWMAKLLLLNVFRFIDWLID